MSTYSDKQEQTIRSLLNQLKALKKEMRPLTDYQYNFIKELSGTKWDNLLSRVNRMAQEVFQEVMETEMTLARIQEETLGDLEIPEHIKHRTGNSLLNRMNTLKQTILAKKEQQAREEDDSFMEDDSYDEESQTTPKSTSPKNQSTANRKKRRSTKKILNLTVTDMDGSGKSQIGKKKTTTKFNQRL